MVSWSICASVRSVAAVHLALERGVAAIGLFALEFLLPDAGVMPDRAFYAEAFEAVLEAAYPLPVTFRLLDLAAEPTSGRGLPDSGYRPARLAVVRLPWCGPWRRSFPASSPSAGVSPSACWCPTWTPSSNSSTGGLQ